MFIIKMIFLLLTIGAFAWFGVVGKLSESGYSWSEWKFNKKQLVAVIPFTLFIATNFFVIIPANTVGIMYSPIKGVKNETLPEGLATKGFFDKVYQISTEIQTKELEEVTGQTKDSQYVSMDVDIKYRVNAATAFEVFKQFRTLRNVDKQLISPITQRAIESVTTKYNIIEVLGEQRNEIYRLIESELKTRFAEAGIEFYSITFVDTDGGVEIENAIKAEAVAKKQVETAQQEKLKAEIEAETKIIEAKAEAEANRLIAESITQGLIDKMEAEARLKHGWVTVQGGTAIVDNRED